jgi:hypothetical protein
MSMPPDYVYPKTSHLDYPSVFSEIKLPNDKDQLEAVKIWELAADAKYIDIVGYGQQMLYVSIAPQDCAKIEVERIDILLNTGSCELLTGYNDFDLEQIPLCYKAMVFGRWTDFTSIEATKAYLDSEQDDEKLEDYFSRKWVVTTQVQALIWYRKFMLDIVKNGISFREDKNSTGDEKSPTGEDESSTGEDKAVNGKPVRPINDLQKKDDWYGLIEQAHEEYSSKNTSMHEKMEFFNWIGNNKSFCDKKNIKVVKCEKRGLIQLETEWDKKPMSYSRFSKRYDSYFKQK